MPRKTAGLPPLALWLQWLLAALILLGLAGVTALAVLAFSINEERFRTDLQQELAVWMGRTVELGKAELRLGGGVGLAVNGLVIYGREGELEMRARALLVELDWPALITQRLQLRAIELAGAEIFLRRNRKGVWNLADLSRRPLPTGAIEINLDRTGIRLPDATVTIEDTAVVPGQQFQIAPLSFRLDPLERRQWRFEMQGQVYEVRGKALASLTVSGTATGSSWNDLDFDASVFAEKVRPRFLRAYTRKLPALAGLAGVYDLDGRYKGKLAGPARLEGMVNSRLLHWSWPKVLGKAPWVTRQLRVETAMVLGTNGLVIERLHLHGAHLDAQVSGSVLRPSAPSAPPLLNLTVATAAIDPFAARSELPIAGLAEPLRSWVSGSRGSGKLRARLRLRGPLDRPMTTGEVALTNLTYTHPRLAGPLPNLTGRVLMEPGVFRLLALRLGAAERTATVYGTIARAARPYLNLQLRSGPTDLAPLSVLAADQLGQLDGSGRLDLAVSGTPGRLQLRGRVELAGATLGRPGWQRILRDGRGRLDFTPERLTLAAVSARLGAGDLRLAGTIDNYASSPRPNLTLVSRALDLQATGVALRSGLAGRTFAERFERELSSLGGRAAVDLRLRSEQLEGRLELRGARLGLTGLGTTLEDLRGEVELAETAVLYSELRGSIAGTPVRFRHRPDGEPCQEAAVAPQPQNCPVPQLAVAQEVPPDCPCLDGVSRRCLSEAERRLREALHRFFGRPVPGCAASFPDSAVGAPADSKIDRRR